MDCSFNIYIKYINYFLLLLYIEFIEIKYLINNTIKTEFNKNHFLLKSLVNTDTPTTKLTPTKPVPIDLRGSLTSQQYILRIECVPNTLLTSE